MFRWFPYFRSKSNPPEPSEPAVNIESLGAQPIIRQAKYKIGQVVHHRMFPFRGVIFDVDPQFANTEEWFESIPEKVRPNRDQPYYHIFAENNEGHYTAYVSEQNLVIDNSNEPIQNPDIDNVFTLSETGQYQLRETFTN